MEYCDYQVLNIDKVCCSKLDLNDQFFDSLREDYEKFNIWFSTKQKNNAIAYVYKNINNKIWNATYKVDMK